MDLIARVHHNPTTDEKVQIHSFEHFCGGSATNTAVALARLGHRTALLSKLGNDENGNLLSKDLEENNVLRGYIQKINHMTSFTFVGLEDEGTRVVYSYKGETAILSPEDIPNSLNNIKMVYCAGVDSRSITGVKKLFEKANYAILAPSSYLLTNMDKDLLELSHAIIVNKHEWKMIDNYCPNDKIIVVTQGKKGVSAYSNGKHTFVSAYPTNVVDTTGAGDAFSAGMISGLIDKKSIKASLQRGCAMSALSISVSGAHTLNISKNMLFEKMSEHNESNGD